MYGVEMMDFRQCEQVHVACDRAMRSEAIRIRGLRSAIANLRNPYPEGRTRLPARIARTEARLAEAHGRLAALRDWRQALADRLKVTLVDAF